METNLAYDEMLEERIAADREVQIVLARLRATIVVVWRHCRRRPRAGALRREKPHDPRRLLPVLRLRINRG